MSSISESADEDWERDFDVELTEEDMKAADEIAKKLNLSSTDYTKLSADVVINICIIIHNFLKYMHNKI